MKTVGGVLRVCEPKDKKSDALEFLKGQGVNISDIAEPPSDLVAALGHVIRYSRSARELIEDFREKCRCYVVPAGGGIETTALVREDNKLAVVYLNIAKPVCFALKQGGVRKVTWSLIALHELGHAWQCVNERKWYGKQQDSYAELTTLRQKGSKITRKQLTGGIMTLDYNNLVNWEWPICQELGFPIREHYNLFLSTPRDAEKARKALRRIKDTGEKLFFGYYFDAFTRKKEGVWRKTPAAAMPKREWSYGAPMRERIASSSGLQGSMKVPANKYPLYKKEKVEIKRDKKDPIPVRTYYKVLTRNTMRVTQNQLKGLERVNAQDPRVKLPMGSIILHYLPKKFSYFEPLENPKKFSAANHCSIVTKDKEITHAIIPGVRSDPITQFYFQGQYGIVFKIDEKYDPFGHAGTYAAQQAAEFKELAYSNAGALGLQARVALKAFGASWLSHKPKFGSKAANRRRVFLKKLKEQREKRLTEEMKKPISRMRSPLAKQSTLLKKPLWEKPDQTREMHQNVKGKKKRKKYTKKYKDEPDFFCSEFVVMCYQLTLHTHDARFPELDAHNSTPDNLEQALLEHPMWNPVAIIDP